MAYELIDIVNEHDEVIGNIERTPAWDKNTANVFRVVAALIWRTDGRLLVQRRALHKSAPLKFDASFGGMATTGLTPDQAAAKELQEELGLTQPLALLAKIKSYREDASLRAFIYLYTLQHDGPYTNWEDEAERLEFFTPEEMDHMTARFPYMFTQGMLEIWQFYRQMQKGT